MTTTKALVEDAVIYIPRSTIHPDPDQPRLKIDLELQSSIDSEGIIQAITVRPHPDIADEWMIVDGERRWMGGAHLKTIPCRIRLDLETPVQRLITQLAANTGKPLTPIEQARAYKKALDQDPKLTQSKLAERLGVPRSTIGDRIRLIEIHPAWMKVIESGRLQVSHAPLIHQYRAVPDEYQVKAAKNVSENEGWQMKKYPEKEDIIPIAAFRKVLHEAFRDYVVRLDQVRSYKGPVLEIEEETWNYGSGTRLKKVKYAADITLWRPIKRAAEKRAKTARESSSSGSSYRYTSPLSTASKQIAAAGYDLPARKTTKNDVEVFGESNWAPGIDPKTLLAKLDPATLAIGEGQYGARALVTTDTTAVAAARAAYNERVQEVAKKELAPLRTKLSDQVLAEHAVKGAGVSGLITYLRPERGEPKIVALALGLSIAGELGDDEYGFEDEPTVVLAEGSKRADAERLLSALSAVAALKIRVPDNWSIENKIRQAVGNPAFKVRQSAVQIQKAMHTSADLQAAKSKKQQKREARAAGKQLGDPTRAKKTLEDPEREFVETDLELEEELVEA